VASACTWRCTSAAHAFAPAASRSVGAAAVVCQTRRCIVPGAGWRSVRPWPRALTV